MDFAEFLSEEKWRLRLEEVRTDYPVIDDLSPYINESVPSNLVYGSSEYSKFWSTEALKCIEGLWAEHRDGWRYCPGNLYFYANYVAIMDTEYSEGYDVTRYVRPRLVDYVWELAAMSWVARGFVGFEGDEEVSCHPGVLSYHQGKLTMDEARSQLPEYCFGPHGIKRYEDPFQYLLRLHDKPKGRSLFSESRDYMILGTRGGGKALHPATPMYCMTPEGVRLKPIGQIQRGDRVWGGDGNLTTVTGVYMQQEADMYEVRLASGRTVRCDGRHIWTVWADGAMVELSCEELKQKLEQSECYIPVVGRIENTYHSDIEELIGMVRSADEVSVTGKVTDQHWMHLLRSFEARSMYAQTLWENSGYVDVDGDKLLLVLDLGNAEAARFARDLFHSIGINCRLGSHMGNDVVLLYTHDEGICGGIDVTRVCSEFDTRYDQIVEIVPAGKSDSVCISVAAQDGLYQCGAAVVTHNSYWQAGGEIEYRFVFGDAKRYDDNVINGQMVCKIVVGSSDGHKSSELLQKFEQSQQAKANYNVSEFRKWFGVQMEYIPLPDGTQEAVVRPCPFYRNHSGSLDPNNMADPYVAKYWVKEGNIWRKHGVDHAIIHVNYSSLKARGRGAQAAVGGRYNYSVIEEVGTMDNLLKVRQHNAAALLRKGFKFGVEAYIGTSGNLELINATKTMFVDPESYRLVSFSDVFARQSGLERTAYFLPHYITNFDAKDSNGNTDYRKALEMENRKREELASSSDPGELYAWCMNNPNRIDEMWYRPQGSRLPASEASIRLKEIYGMGGYRALGTAVELFEMKNGTVGYRVLHDHQPIVDWPLDPAKVRMNAGAVVIYEHPEMNAPSDLYIAWFDPYVEEDIERGGSLGVTYIYKRNWYEHMGIIGDSLVASYIAKPVNGLEEYFRTQELLLQYYGVSNGGLWYESMRGGEECKAYYFRRGKASLLCLRPQFSRGDSAHPGRVRSYGVVIYNRESKLMLLTQFRDWLLRPALDHYDEHGQPVMVKNIFRIPCVMLLRQIEEYSLEGNYDCVSAALVGMASLAEEAVRRDMMSRRSDEREELFRSLLTRVGIQDRKKDGKR
ncbi:MAG: hypothetical protein KatS3mg054_0049 [Chloroflexus sp.]|nr:MAG: hypothetical protein KatS3mg054_0049 [Chloroflexus sp.]